MRKARIIINFKNNTDSDMSDFGQSVITGMTGNPDFTTPVPSLADVSTAIANFDSAKADASTGNHAAVELKNQKRQILEELLYELGLYVELQSDGDIATMRRSGFKTTKDPAPVGPLPKPTGFRVQSTGKGVIKLGLDRLQGAVSYQFEFKEATAADWSRKISSKTRLLLTDLPSGKEYFFRVLPIGTSDVREYSDEISSFVL